MKNKVIYIIIGILVIGIIVMSILMINNKNKTDKYRSGDGNISNSDNGKVYNYETGEWEERVNEQDLEKAPKTILEDGTIRYDLEDGVMMQKRD